MALEWIDMFLEPVPQNEEGKVSHWQRILATAAYLLFWIVFTLIGLWLMFELREVTVDLMIRIGLNPWAVRGYDRLGIYILGLIWFVGLMWIEHYLRTAIDKKRLWRSIGRVATVEAVLAAFALGTRYIINL
jgi:hypothetical protein